jgi:hypothetical protein
MNPDTKSLAGLQQAFQAYVHEAGKLDGIVDAIQPDKTVPAQQRLGIYERAYNLRLLEALNVDYPGLHALAGDDEFDAIGRDFIDACPSTFYNLRWYGGELPQFLRTSEAWREYSVLAEMADFEWALSTAFDAADDPVLQVEDIGRVPPEDWPEMGFQTHASVQRVDLQWDVVAVWKAAKEEREAEAPEKHEAPVHWIIWRADLRTLFRSLEEDETAAFDALRDGANFGQLCELLLQWHEIDGVAVRAAQLLKQWTQEGLLRQPADESGTENSTN